MNGILILYQGLFFCIRIAYFFTISNFNPRARNSLYKPGASSMTMFFDSAPGCYCYLP